MKYEEAYKFIEKCNQLGSIPGLTSIKKLTKELGNPQDSLKFVHIAGTNGKGSTLAYLSTILQQAGYRVGRYISPTIFEYRERFQFNGKMMGKDAFCGYIQQVKTACEKMTAKGDTHPTAFEVETAVAFLYFLDKKCDIVILETGMGGKLDATNIITTPVLTVLTSISMDHMQYLGDNLAEITQQKCGILKEGVPVVTAGQHTEAMEVIKEQAAGKKVPLFAADTKELSKIRYGISRQSFYYKNQKYEISLPGICQIENAFLALKAIEVLQDVFPVAQKMLLKALAETQWRGRFSVLSKKPYFIVDGAHNVDAAGKLRESLHFYFTNRKIIYIMGMFKDKEYEKVIALMGEDAAQIITVAAPHNPRALPALELAKAVSRVNEHVTAADSLEEAVEMAYLFADQDMVIVAFGSLAYLGELMTIVEKGKTVRSDTHDK